MIPVVAPDSIDDIELLESLAQNGGLPSELAAHLEMLVEGQRRRQALAKQLEAFVAEKRRAANAPKIDRRVARTRLEPRHGDVGLLTAWRTSKLVRQRSGEPLGSYATGPNERTSWIIGGVLSYLPREAWLTLVAASPGLAQQFLVLEPSNDGSFDNVAGMIERAGAEYPGELYEHMRVQIRRQTEYTERARATAPPPVRIETSEPPTGPQAGREEVSS